MTSVLASLQLLVKCLVASRDAWQQSREQESDGICLLILDHGWDFFRRIQIE